MEFGLERSTGLLRATNRTGSCRHQARADPRGAARGSSRWGRRARRAASGAWLEARTRTRGGVRMRRRLAAVTPWLAIVALLGLLAAVPRERSVTFPIHAMGTYVNVTLVTADSAAAAGDAAAAHRAVQLVDSLMSNWTTTSEVARINRIADSTTTPVQPLVGDVIARSLRVWPEGRHT